MSEFLAMGGYAWYVWGSYGVTFALLALEVFLLTQRLRKAKASEATS
jgi:heme exporter protein D